MFQNQTMSDSFQAENHAFRGTVEDFISVPCKEAEIGAWNVLCLNGGNTAVFNQDSTYVAVVQNSVLKVLKFKENYSQKIIEEKLDIEKLLNMQFSGSDEGHLFVHFKTRVPNKSGIQISKEKLLIFSLSEQNLAASLLISSKKPDKNNSFFWHPNKYCLIMTDVYENLFVLGFNVDEQDDELVNNLPPPFEESMNFTGIYVFECCNYKKIKETLCIFPNHNIFCFLGYLSKNNLAVISYKNLDKISSILIENDLDYDKIMYVNDDFYSYVNPKYIKESNKSKFTCEVEISADKITANQSTYMLNCYKKTKFELPDSALISYKLLPASTSKPYVLIYDPILLTKPFRIYDVAQGTLIFSLVKDFPVPKMVYHFYSCYSFANEDTEEKKKLFCCGDNYLNIAFFEFFPSRKQLKNLTFNFGEMDGADVENVDVYFETRENKSKNYFCKSGRNVINDTNSDDNNICFVKKNSEYLVENLVNRSRTHKLCVNKLEISDNYYTVAFTINGQGENMKKLFVLRKGVECGYVLTHIILFLNEIVDFKFNENHILGVVTDSTFTCVQIASTNPFKSFYVPLQQMSGRCNYSNAPINKGNFISTKIKNNTNNVTTTTNKNDTPGTKLSALKWAKNNNCIIYADKRTLVFTSIELALNGDLCGIEENADFINNDEEKYVRQSEMHNLEDLDVEIKMEGDTNLGGNSLNDGECEEVECNYDYEDQFDDVGIRE